MFSSLLFVPLFYAARYLGTVLKAYPQFARLAKFRQVAKSFPLEAHLSFARTDFPRYWHKFLPIFATVDSGARTRHGCLSWQMKGEMRAFCPRIPINDDVEVDSLSGARP